MHIFCAVVGFTFKLLPATYAASLWGGALFVYYMLTSFGEPEHTGGVKMRARGPGSRRRARCVCLSGV